MKILKNYKSMLILILSIFVGGLVGIIFGEGALKLKPFGDLFLNLMLIVIVPLIFLSIATSIYKMKHPKRMGKIIVTTFIVFLITSVVAVMIGVVSTYSYRLVDIDKVDDIKNELVMSSEDTEVSVDLLDKMVSMLTVDDFSKLLSRDSMIALIVVSLLFGFSMYMSGSKGNIVYEFMDSFLDILNNYIRIIMYYAPFGMGCYFASLVGTFGASIAIGYAKTFIIYLVATLVCYFIIYSIYAYISGGKKGVKVFWKNVIPSTLMSLTTCSSAASMPVNIDCTKKIGVSSDVADATISLGTSFHKDGSVIGSVFKIMFLVYLFNDFGNISVFKVIGVAIIATLLVTAVPIGGGTISEMLIITMLGYPVATLPILTIIATIIDPPATMLNVVGDSVSAMLVSRIVDGKKWLS